MRNLFDLLLIRRKNYSHRSTKPMTYHGREGYPLIHYDKQKKKEYIMVRQKRGGTKRLYLIRGNVPKHLRHK